MATKKEDRRVQRTRRALLDAFRTLFLERRYDQIRVADIVARADVGRSTFYEHYTDKEAILAESIQGPFGVLATAVADDCEQARLQMMLDHFWQNRARTRFIFGGAARRPVARVLARMIEERLRPRHARLDAAVTMPVRLAAVGLADALLGAVAAWASGEAACTVAVLANALHMMGARSVAALYPESGRR